MIGYEILLKIKEKCEHSKIKFLPLNMQCITSSIDCSKTNTSNIPIPKDKEENVSYSPLHYTCSCGDFNLAEQLLSQGYNANIVDINGNGALHWAAKSGNVDLVDLLVEKHGAKMNSQNNAGWSPLHFSLKFGNDAISLYFLSKGCDPNIQDLQGVSPLHIACAVGNLQILDVLYKHGAWLEIEDEEGDTPLHYAVRENHINVIQWLLQHGADQNHPNSDMETPLDLVEVSRFIIS